MTTDSNKLAAGARSVVEKLRSRGFTAYWAGGCVRDFLMGRAAKDYDIATDATPDQVEALFEHTHAIGKAFGVIQVMLGELPYEVATFRRDAAYLDGRHPSAIEPSNPKEDAQRRDFTVNGLFYDPLEKTVIDYVNGERDIHKRVIRAIGLPGERFHEDHLRLLRAVRFAATLEFCIEPQTWEAVQQQAALIKTVSPERIQQELSRLLVEAPRAGDGLRMLYESGLLEHLIPEVLPMVGCEQPPQWHPEGDVFEHTVLMLNTMSEPDLHLAWSILLHDIGKPPTMTLGTDKDGSPRIRFNNHARVGAEMAEAILTRLRFSNADREAIVYCVDHHMRFMDVQRMRDNSLRKMVASPYFPTELELHRIDCLSCHGMLDNHAFLEDYLDNLVLGPKLPDPLVSGHDLIALGIPKGRDIGKWKEAAFDQQLARPEASREELLNWVRDQWAASGA